MAIFGSASGGEGIFHSPLVVMLSVLIFTYFFVKFCSWAKKNTLSAGVKKAIFILTIVGLVGINVFYYIGNSAISQGKGWSLATYALVGALIWVFIFAYALMTEKREPAE
ncbi:MAG: hypothetical protein LBK69_06430 [Syntrophomonadaceae bacterium]|nr:hypothetical protein [Syntrophomonadaceae bacterium]